MEKITLGYAMTGSFCTFEKSIAEMARLRSLGYELLPIMSENAYSTSTRCSSICCPMSATAAPPTHSGARSPRS